LPTYSEKILRNGSQDSIRNAINLQLVGTIIWIHPP